MAKGLHTEALIGERQKSISREPTADVTVIVVNYNTASLLDRFFASLEAARANLNVQIVFVDNASRDDSVRLVREKYPDVEVLENDVNVGFGRANNQALPFVKGRYVLLLNTDAFVAPETLRSTVTFMDESPSCGILGVKLVGEDGQLQPSCRYFPTPWNVFLASTGLSKLFPRTRLVDDMSWDHESVRECDWVPGCYYLIRTSALVDVGLFDPRFFMYYEEVDHCMRMKAAGWRVVYFPFTSVIHLGGESAAKSAQVDPSSRQVPHLQRESEMLYFRKHFGLLRGVVVGAVLYLLGEGLRAGNSIVRRRQGDRLRGASQRARTHLSLMRTTGLGSRPSR